MSRKVLITLCTIVLIFTINACTTNTKATTTPTTNTYIVTRDTGLYDEPKEYADQIAILSTNTKVQPVGNKLDCETFYAETIKLTLCHVKIPSTLQEGWVLQNALKKQ